MRLDGLQGATRRKKWRTTKRAKDARPAPDLVERDFSVEGPDRLWVADITYVPTSSGFLYLSVVVDAWSRRVVGWSMKTHLRTDLVLDALNMALQQRRPNGVIHHSDQGTQPRFKGSSQQHRVEGGFLPPSRPSSSIGKTSETRPRPGWPCSTSSRPGTIHTGGIQPSATCLPSTTKGGMLTPPESLAQNRPPDGANSIPGPAHRLRRISGSSVMTRGQDPGERFHRTPPVWLQANSLAKVRPRLT